MKKVLFPLFFLFIFTFLVSCSSDAKVVKKLPQGFIKLSGRGVAPNNILKYKIDGIQIIFINGEGDCIYQTTFRDYDFIVKYEGNYFVNEVKYLELFDSVTVSQVVNELPPGFAQLRTAEDDLIYNNGGLHYKFQETQILFLDANETCVYQTELSNSNFIVIYNFDYYIDYKKYLELVDLVTSVQKVQTQPAGFIPLAKAIDNQKNGISYILFEKTISFLDADSIGIYGTVIYDKSFLVVYEGVYYVNEKKFLDIVKLADTTVEKRNKIYNIGEDVELRDKPYLLKINEVKAAVNGNTEVYTIKYTISPTVTDYQKKKIFDHIETDQGTIINQFSFTGVGEVQVTVPVGEKLDIIVVKSPDYAKAIRKISVR